MPACGCFTNEQYQRIISFTACRRVSRIVFYPAITITHIAQLVKTIANMFSPRLRSDSFRTSSRLSLEETRAPGCYNTGETIVRRDNQVLNSWRQPLGSCIRRIEPLSQGRRAISPRTIFPGSRLQISRKNTESRAQLFLDETRRANLRIFRRVPFSLFS